MKEKLKEKYKNNEGKVIPGVTTITGELGWNTGALIHWAWKLGTEGIDYRKHRDDKADIGTLAHRFILAEFTGETVDTSEYSEKQISLAENSLLKYYEWLKRHDISPIKVETPLISEQYQFGGTPDFYGMVDGKYELTDYKTGGDIYLEALVQLGGYILLLEEHSLPVEIIRILNIPRTEDENFKELTLKNFEISKKLFLDCLDIYNLKKELKKEIENE